MIDNTILYALIAAFVIAIAFVAWRRNPDNFMQELKAAAEMAVADVEQTIPGATNEQKLATVLERLGKIGKFSNTEKELLRMAVEAAVKMVKHPGEAS